MRATIPSKPGGRDADIYVRLHLYVDIFHPTNFHINLAFSSFILPLHINLTVLLYPNNYEAS